jgi:hypothetical protein
MKKYLFTFFGGNPALKYSNLDKASQEARAAHLNESIEWMAGLAKAGKLEGGYPLESAGKNVNSAGVEDHDFSKDGAGGFIILKADSLDEAAKIASSSPIIKNGGEIYVQPCGEIKSHQASVG